MLNYVPINRVNDQGGVVQMYPELFSNASDNDVKRHSLTLLGILTNNEME